MSIKEQVITPIKPEVFPINDILPHGEPVILLGQMESYAADFFQASVVIGENSPFYDHALGGVPAWIGIEYMAQAIAAWAGVRRIYQEKPIVPGFLLGAQSYHCASPVFKVGQVMQVTVNLQMESSDGLGAFSCKLNAASGELLAEAVVNAFSPDDPSEIISIWLEKSKLAKL